MRRALVRPICAQAGACARSEPRALARIRRQASCCGQLLGPSPLSQTPVQRLQQRLAQRFGAAVFAAVAALGSLLLEAAPVARAAGDEPRANGCPSEMVRVHEYCVDRWELSLVDVASGEPLSPYYPPEPRL